MNKALYIIALILVAIWAIGFFMYSIGMVIHAVLVLAIVILLFKFITGNTVKK